jgi:prepilin-type N-terminal cleavage/methylation domain-containing protein
VLFVPPREKKESNKMKQTKNMRKAGFTLVEIMIVVAIIGLLAAIAIPNFVKARATSQANACINNLRQIDAAVNELALETHLTTGAAVTLTALTPYIKLNANSSIPPCPALGAYTVTTVGVTPQCSLGNSVTPGHYLP